MCKALLNIHKISIVLSGEVTGISRTAFYYQAKRGRWDFMNDTLRNNIRFCTFNVIDDFNNEVLGIDIGTDMTAKRVTRYLDHLAQ